MNGSKTGNIALGVAELVKKIKQAEQLFEHSTEVWKGREEQYKTKIEELENKILDLQQRLLTSSEKLKEAKVLISQLATMVGINLIGEPKDSHPEQDKLLEQAEKFLAVMEER